MWPKELAFIHDFNKAILEFLLLNTIRRHGEVTYNDLHEITSIPPSRIYRFVKKLESRHFLTRRDELLENNRPKHYFALSAAGTSRLEHLQGDLRHFFEFLQTRVPQGIPADFDVEGFLEKGTLKIFCKPASLVEQDPELSDAEKLTLLSEMEENVANLLAHVREEKRVVQARVDHDPAPGQPPRARASESESPG